MGCGPNVDQPRHAWAEAFRVLDLARHRRPCQVPDKHFPTGLP